MKRKIGLVYIGRKSGRDFEADLDGIVYDFGSGVVVPTRTKFAFVLGRIVRSVRRTSQGDEMHKRYRLDMDAVSMRRWAAEVLARVIV